MGLQPLFDPGLGLQAKPFDVFPYFVGASDFSDFKELVDVVFAPEEDPLVKQLARVEGTMPASQQPTDHMSMA